MADAFAELLEHIVRDYAITDAQKDVDLNAPADEPAADIEAESSTSSPTRRSERDISFPSSAPGSSSRLKRGHRQARDSARRSGPRAKRHRRRADCLSGALRPRRVAQRGDRTGTLRLLHLGQLGSAVPGCRGRGHRSSGRAGQSGVDSGWLMARSGTPRIAIPSTAEGPKPGEKLPRPVGHRQRGAAGASAAFSLSGPRSVADRADPSLDLARGRQRGHFDRAAGDADQRAARVSGRRRAGRGRGGVSLQPRSRGRRRAVDPEAGGPGASRDAGALGAGDRPRIVSLPGAGRATGAREPRPDAGRGVRSRHRRRCAGPGVRRGKKIPHAPARTRCAGDSGQRRGRRRTRKVDCRSCLQERYRRAPEY